MGIYLIVPIAAVWVAGIIFLAVNPRFGKGATKIQKAGYAASGNYYDKKFNNTHSTEMDIHFFSLLGELWKRSPNRKPKKDVAVEKVDFLRVKNHETEKARLIWFGHSTILLFIDGKSILIDPMFGKSPSPFPFLGTKRYSKALPMEIEDIPYIDIVILSHDHYDHLDYKSIQKLKGKAGRFFTPYGVGNHLTRWGIEKDMIKESGWWEEVEYEGLRFICAPARHFSGRGLFDRASTLWCSWVIQGTREKVFFSGDSGYDDHFKEIGDKYGPFDVSLVECGQYHRDWKLFHMMPEETVQASIDLKSKLAMPIHWGAFTLSLHDWSDPVERFTKKAGEMNMPYSTPRIGESVIIGTPPMQTARWWEAYCHPQTI